MSRTYSIRTVLMVLMIGETIAAIFITAWLWYDNGQASVQNLTEDRCLEISLRVEEQLHNLITTARNTADTQKDFISAGIIDPTSEQDVQRLLDHQIRHLRRHRFLSTVGIGFADGSFFGAQRDPDGDLQELRSLPGEDVLYERSLDDAESSRNEGFQVTARPWYQQAVATNGPGWTGIYQFSGTPPQLGASAYQVIPGIDQEVAGVALCDITLGPIDQFLRGLRLTENGRSLVFDPAGLLVATSRGNSLQEDSSGALHRVRAAECEDRLIRDTITEMETSLGDISSWPASGAREIDTENGRIFTVWSPLIGQGGIDLTSLIAIPIDDLVTEISQRTRSTALAFLALILATLPIAWRTAAGITRPVRELNKDMKKIARFEIEGEAGRPSRLTELNQMQERMEAMRHALVSFEKYVPSRVVRQLVTNDRVARPGMEEATACVYFSDVIGFTSIAETLPPDQLVSLGGEYLEEMTQQIQKHDGILDKFIGDAIMAFWIAEVDGTRVTSRACRAALESQRCLAAMRADWSKRSLPELRARIGLHTGAVLVGNIGSSNRLNYTVLGDTVNLASRLEGLNRVYDTEVIVSEEVAAVVADEMHCRLLDQVAVKGRRQGGAIYELVCEVNQATDGQIEIAALHRSAIELYVDGDFASAANAFRNNQTLFPDDKASKVLADRCEIMSKNPPEDWTGYVSLDRNIQEQS